MRRLHLCLTIAVATCLVPLTACDSRANFTYVPDAGSYTTEELKPLLSSLDKPTSMGLTVAESSDPRHEALVDLRSQGGDGADLANLITEQFPADTRGVPYWGGMAKVDGAGVWLIAETWGPRGGSLNKLRLWVFERSTQDLITSVVLD